MYLHLGQGTVIHMDDIVGIFDLDTSSISKHTRDYLARAEKAGQVVTVTSELPKSFVACVNRTGDRILYLSQISSATLLRRANRE